MGLKAQLLVGAAAVAFTVSCGGDAQPPSAPSAVDAGGGAATGPGDSTLKVTAPKPTSPADGSTILNLRPALVVSNSTGLYVGVSDLAYRFQVSAAGGAPVETVVAGGDGTTTLQTPANLAPTTKYTWKARAETKDGKYVGPWSASVSFTTPAAGPAVDIPRIIGVNEAASIIKTIYTELKYNIGSNSTRDQRNVYLQRAVAALHFGHVRFNPAGRDSNWCIKNGGPGRPQSDDVIVRCDTREAWDLIGGIGGDAYHWGIEYIGRLPGDQAVYPPPRSALDALPY